MLQCLDVETERTHGLRDLLKLGLLRRVIRLRKPGNAGLAARKRSRRLVRPQNHQRAEHLFDLAIEPGQIAALGGVTKERVKGGFNAAQIAFDFTHYMRHQQALLRLARHFVE